jgi:hypothetical protein
MSSAPRRRPKKTSPGAAAPRTDLAYRALRPLSRLLLASGFTPAELRALVARAVEEHGRERVRGTWQENAFESLLGSAAAVVSTWRQGVRWLDGEGEPRPLTLTRTGSGSFADLVREAAPGMGPQAVLADLERTETVVRQPRGEIRLVGRAIVLAGSDQFEAIGVLTHLRRFLEMVEHNVFELDDPSEGLLERAVHAANLDPERFAEFNRVMRRHLEAFVLAGDATLRDYAVKEPGAPTGAYGFGVYVFRDPDTSAPPPPRTRRRRR